MWCAPCTRCFSPFMYSWLGTCFLFHPNDLFEQKNQTICNSVALTSSFHLFYLLANGFSPRATLFTVFIPLYSFVRFSSFRYAMRTGASSVWLLALVTWSEHHIENTFMFYRLWISGERYTRELINDFSQRFAVWLIATKIARTPHCANGSMSIYY